MQCDISNWHGNKTLDYNFYRQNKLPSHESKHFKLKMTSLHDTSVQDKQEYNFNKISYYKTYNLTFPAQTFTGIFQIHPTFVAITCVLPNYNFLAIPPHKICTSWVITKTPFRSNHLIQNTHYISTIQMAFYYPFIFYCSPL